MSFKNHGPGGCCCGDCCEIWDRWERRQGNNSVYRGIDPEITNKNSTRHPLHATSTDNDWVFDRNLPVAGFPFADKLWTTATTPPGGTSRCFRLGLGGTYFSGIPTSWSPLQGGSIEFDLEVSQAPGAFGVFLGQKRINQSYYPFPYSYEECRGCCVYMEFTDSGFYATPVGGGINGDDYQGLTPFADAHAVERINNQSSNSYTDNPLSVSGTSHLPNGKRTELPGYDLSNNVSVRIEFHGRYERDLFWAQWFINDYHFFNWIMSARFDALPNNPWVNSLGFSAGWGLANASDIEEGIQDYWDTLSLEKQELLTNTYEGQGWSTPSTNCVYKIKNPQICFNAYTDRLVEETHPRPTYNSTDWGPVKAVCPDEPPETRIFGYGVSSQSDFIDEGSDGPWKKTTFGYGNPDLGRRWRTWSTNANGGSGTPIYFDDELTSSFNFGITYHSKTWSVAYDTSPFSLSFTMYSQPYISYLYSVTSLIVGTTHKVTILGRYEWDGELAPPTIIADGTWGMTLQRTLHNLNEVEDFTFGESGSQYISRFTGTANQAMGDPRTNDFTQVLFDEIWGSSWELSVSVT